MTLAILQDASSHPELFSWVGPLNHAQLVEFLHLKRWQIPIDLLDLWLRTGGGDFFESETFFAPFSDVWADDKLESVNASLWCKGMPKQYLAIHDGIKFTTLDLSNARYYFVDEHTFAVTDTFDSLNSWYLRGLRPLFQEKYSL